MVLEVYATKLEEIRQYARENDISESEIDRALQNSFRIVQKKRKRCRTYCMRIMILILFMITICFVSLDRRFLTAIIMRNLQNSIYPGLKLLRKVAIPIIQHYPSMSGMFTL